MDRVKYEYDCLEAWSLRDLTAICSNYLNAGWKALGGVALSRTNEGSRMYAQAFVREVGREGDE